MVKHQVDEESKPEKVVVMVKLRSANEEGFSDGISEGKSDGINDGTELG